MDITRNWEDLPIEILEQFLFRLPQPDRSSFRLVCKSWSEITVPVAIDNTPLLFYFKKCGDKYFHYYYNPILDKTFKVPSHYDMSDKEPYYSKNGWLLLLGSGDVEMLNPITNEMVVYGGCPIQRYRDTHAIMFSGIPESDNFTIFAIKSRYGYVEISLYRNNKWLFVNARCDNEDAFYLDNSNSSLVEVGGKFMCLGSKGSIGVFDPNIEAFDHLPYAWVVVSQPRRIPCFPGKSFLVAGRDNQLLAVIIRRCPPFGQVLSRNEETSEWEKSEELHHTALFVGPKISLLRCYDRKEVGNSIFYSRLHGQPETVNAVIGEYLGKPCFATKYHASREDKKEGSKKKGQSRSVIYYHLIKGQRSSSFRSIQQPCTLWYEPMV